MPKACNDKSTAELTALVLVQANEERVRFGKELEDAKITQHIEATMHKIEDSLTNDTEDWKALIPGRIILKTFCSKTPLKYDAFRTAFINAAEGVSPHPFADIIQIFREFNSMTLEPGGAV